MRPDLLRDWAARLEAAGVASPGVDVRFLAAHVLGVSPAALVLAGDPDPEQAARIEALVRRRECREPLQHILGTAAFLDLELEVGPGVFVPRPETEVMAGHVIDWLRAPVPVPRQAREPVEGPLPSVPEPVEGPVPEPVEGRSVVVDLCTGSGALALAIACHVPGARVTAVDVSGAALAYARRNAAALAPRRESLGSRVEFVREDLASPGAAGSAWTTALAGTVDVVVTNPPYVPDDAIPRDPEVRDHDPPLALFGGPDGFAVLRPILRLAAMLLRPSGLLAVEHGDEQGGPDGVPGLVRDTGFFRQVTDHTDLAARPRFTTALRRQPAVRF